MSKKAGVWLGLGALVAAVFAFARGAKASDARAPSLGAEAIEAAEKADRGAGKRAPLDRLPVVPGPVPPIPIRPPVLPPKRKVRGPVYVPRKGPSAPAKPMPPRPDRVPGDSEGSLPPDARGKRKPKPAPVVVVPVPVQSGPEGYDPAKAKAMAPGLAVHIQRAKHSYTRKAVADFQRAAGIQVDGVYGPLTASALRYWGGNAPRPLFKGKAGAPAEYREP